MARKRLGIPGLSFSWKLAEGISAAKQKLARMTGIPTTRAGRQHPHRMSSPRRLVALCLLVSLLSLSATPVGASPTTTPSGDLNIVGAVTVDGARAESGQTLFSGSTVETAKGALSTMSLGGLGRVELSEESGLKLSFTDAGVNAMLKAGRVRVSLPAGVSANVVTDWGEVFADPGQASLFIVDVREGKAVVSVQLGRAELRANGEARRVGAGESEASGAGDAPKQSGERQSLSGGKKKGLFLALAGAIAVIVAVALTGRDQNTGIVPSCNGPVVLSGNTGGPCG